MRIVAVTPYPDPLDAERHIAPVEAYAKNLLNNTLDASDDVSLKIYTYYENSPRSFEETRGLDRAVHVEQCFRKDSMPYIPVLKRLRVDRPDIVHVQHETLMYGGMTGFMLFPFFMALSRLYAYSIATLHHVMPREEIRTSFKETHDTAAPVWVVEKAFALFFKLTGIFSTALIVHEEEFKHILIEDYGVAREKIHVIPHGVLAPYEQFTHTSEQLYREFSIPQDVDVVYGFFGYISKYKGLDYLLDEFEKYVKNHLKSVLLIAGDMHPRLSKESSYVSYYKNLKEKAGKIPRVIWYGALDQKQISHFYKVTDCLVLPYQMKIGSSSVLSMAIGSETPFIVSEVLAPTVQNHAVVFGLYPNALVKKMSEFTARNLHAESNFQTFVEELHHKRVWPIIGKKTHDMYAKILRENTPKSHLVIGAYGQANLGDELLLDECLRLLRAQNCVVASSDPDATKSAHGIRAISSHGNPLRLLRAILGVRDVVVGGGDQLKLLKPSMNAWKYRLLVQLLIISAFAKACGKKVYLVGVGIGTINTGAAHILAWAILKLATHVTFREARSYAIAKDIDPTVRGQAGSDLCFLGEPNAWVPSAETHPVIGLAPTLEVDHPEQFAKVVSELARAIDLQATRRTDAQFTFLPFQPTFKAKNDIVISRQILEKTDAAEKCTVDAKLNFKNAAQAYAKLDYIWCMRLHSLLLAVLHGVPFIALVYDEKVRHFLEEIDCTEFGIELDEAFTAEKVLALQQRLESERESIRHSLQGKRAQLQEKCKINLALLNDIQQPTPSPNTL